MPAPARHAGLLIHLAFCFFALFVSQPPSSETLISADWTNAIIALCSMVIALGSMVIAWLTFRFGNRTYSEQQQRNRDLEDRQREKDRVADREQKERDQTAQLELERIRQRTSRLEWYRYMVRSELKSAHEAFEKLHEIKTAIRTSDLSDTEEKDLSTAYTQTIAELRNQLLERILYIHKATYGKLKKELDNMLLIVNKALFDDNLKLNKDNIYEDAIGKEIRGCQERFFDIIDAYQGEK